MGGGTLRNGARTADDLEKARSLGADHLRMFIEPQRAADGRDYTLSSAQWAALERTLLLMEKSDLRMMLVAGFGADARGPIWSQAGLAEAAVRFWVDLASRLKARASVAGFDLVNEPVPDGLTYGIRQTRWLDFTNDLVAAVQAVDPGRVLVVQSAPDATPESFSRMRPLPYRNLVYSVHSYEPFSFTHQGVMKHYPDPEPFPKPLPGGRSTADVLRESLMAVQRFVERHDVPIYVGEFSATRTAPGDSVSLYLANSIELFNRFGWSWSYHEFRAWHGWDVEIASKQLESRLRSPDSPALHVVRRGLADRRLASSGS